MDKLNFLVGVVGAGSMGGAIASGLVASVGPTVIPLLIRAGFHPAMAAAAAITGHLTDVRDFT